MFPRHIQYGGVDWIDLVQDRNRRRAISLIHQLIGSGKTILLQNISMDHIHF